MKLPDWYSQLRDYSKPSTRKSIIQILNSFVPLILLTALMVITVEMEYSYWITLGLALLVSGFFVRVFIIFHDCTHGSFMKSRKWMNFVGHVSGILTFTPFSPWQSSHNKHHATAANLDRRGVGDIWTMTLTEYAEASKMKRFWYRLFRNPFFLFTVAPVFQFFIIYRLPNKGAKKKDKQSLIITNLALLGIFVGFWLLWGIGTYFKVFLPILAISSSLGLWLFFVQHQYETVYWESGKNWDPIKAALKGSSFLKLPAVLRWFSGNIGYHHIHHLHPGIPNYNLVACHKSIKELQEVETLTLFSSFKSLVLHIYDESNGRLIKFKEAKRLINAGLTH